MSEGADITQQALRKDCGPFPQQGTEQQALTCPVQLGAYDVMVLWSGMF